MTVDEATKIKQRYQYILKDASLPELIVADNMSIEALKELSFLRRNWRAFPSIRLPGETE